jgi:ketosteroid isomerase-like protein
MYHAIVKRIALRNFLRVNQKDYSAVLKDCSSDVHHRFGGQHALGGERHDRDALGRWFERLGRLAPALQLTVYDVWVKGWPWNTTVIIRWSAVQDLPDGSPYNNHGVHIIRMRWGKVFDIDANEDSQLVAAAQRGENENAVFERVFTSALNAVAQERKKSTYHFPVVLAGAKSPDEFEIGPVKFRNASRFASWLAELSTQETKIDERIERHGFMQYVQRFGWIASVGVPACSSEIAKARAELAARTAVNIVRLWFGLGHLRRGGQFIEKENALAGRREELRWHPFRLIRCDSRQAS